MADHLKGSRLNGSKKNGVKKRQAQGVTFTVHKNKQGQFYHHPHKGRVEVVALYCDCGRSILVSPKEVKGKPIICGVCDSAFRWQQLSLGMD
ncbi:MAG: hypothetical protein KDJ65_12100 [Anaerolineae bacterium]|nr:hypothetical protein [Anaerolineae bacterium]